jgi:lipopolysaccharide biosynthesis protein
MASTADQPRAIAFYLPQFHPIAENDAAWGAGFTEWQNVVRALPAFRGHRQPILPSDLGFYDLRVPEVRAAQAELAGDYGIDAFCYYHYWFHGRRVLSRPFDEVLSSGEPDLPFCLCWANEPWTRAWDGRTGETILAQQYSAEDDRAHGRWLASAFADPRYLRFEGRPVFAVYRAMQLPDPKRTTDIWRQVCTDMGVGEPWLLRVESFAKEAGDPRPLGFDAAVEFQPEWRRLGRSLHRSRPWRALRRASPRSDAFGRHRIYDYEAVVDRMIAKPLTPYPCFPGVTPSWDNSARRAVNAVILRDPSPAAYERWLDAAFDRARRQSPAPWVFVNAWNEWAEGNVLEPTRDHGRAYLEATRRAVTRARGSAPTPRSLAGH